MPRFRASLLLPALILCLALATWAESRPGLPSTVTIVRKEGHEEGIARAMIDGKMRSISAHAVAGFIVRGGEGALIIVVETAKGARPKRYILRYYDLESRRRRVLGAVPFRQALLAETPDKEDRWAFALSGMDVSTSKPVIVAGCEQGIPGYLPGGNSAAFPADDRMTYALDGASREAMTGVLLGKAKSSIYAPAPEAHSGPQLLQVFPDGTAMALTAAGAIRPASWQTDGETLHVQFKDATPAYVSAWSGLVPVKGVPVGKRFGVRVLQELSSRTTHEHDIVNAVSITPVVVEGSILIPAGSMLEGHVVQADSTGWGFKHETASLTLDWTKATLQDGRVLALDARVLQVENAKEKVTSSGKIQGARATATPGYSGKNGVLTFAGIDPVGYVFASAAGSAVLGFAEPEILYRAGTELILEMEKPLLTSQSYPPSVPPSASSPAAQADLQAFVQKLPFRTRTKGSNKVSDLTNLVFIGPAAGLQRAFEASGWLASDELTADSTFRTIKTLSGNQTYTQAPMSILTLDERPPILALSKTTNTFASRHHIRVFTTSETRDGRTVLTASSTQDTGIAFSKKQKTFIHVIDEHIDNERSKVVNDLSFTGCVESLDLVQRPWVPRNAYNSTGDRLLTDGDVAVVRISDCMAPRTTPATIALPPARGVRIARDTALTLRNDLYRGNLVYQGISGALLLHRFIRSSSELPADSGAWRLTDASGADYRGLGSNASAEDEEHGEVELHRRKHEPVPQATAADLAEIEKAQESHKWDPPRYEFALHGGYMMMREEYLSGVGILEIPPVTTLPAYFLYLQDEVGDGWAVGGSVTVNSWKHFSNEFSYFRQQVKYQLIALGIRLPSDRPVVSEDIKLDTARIGLVTRQFEYNLLWHARPPTSRWRPYAAIGPGFQLITLNGAPLKKPAGVYTVGLKNIGLIQAAFDFGNTPPLDGGGIFQVGLQYGGGMKYRVSPRVMLRADFRETWSRNPDIISNSYEDFNPQALDDSYDTLVVKVKPAGKFLQDRYTMGIAFTF